MGDAMDKYCFQNPLAVMEGVTHAGQAARVAHTFTFIHSAELVLIHHPLSFLCAI